jgi:DNA (cytosine-5)-methyltransferase 1
MRVASVCSGYNAPFLALERLGLAPCAEDVFACDIDGKVRKVLQHNFKDLHINNIFGDVMQLHPEKLAKACGRIDILTAGFPCQPFSMIGNQMGTSDCRGTVIYKIMDLIRAMRPKAFILENVEGMIKQHWESFVGIIRELHGIKTDGMPAYTVTWELLNSRLHSGLPQNRTRLYIVGVATSQVDEGAKPFAWPAKIPMKPLNTVLDPVDPKLLKKPQIKGSKTFLRNYLQAIKKINADKGKLTDDYVGDMGASKAFGSHVTLGHSPCLTRSRAGSADYFVFSRGRPMTRAEMFRIQGVPPKRIVRPKGVSDRDVRLMIGNSNDVHLYARILARVLPAIGFAPVIDILGAESDDALFDAL